jgi:hypothetical protein
MLQILVKNEWVLESGIYIKNQLECFVQDSYDLRKAEEWREMNSATGMPFLP